MENIGMINITDRHFKPKNEVTEFQKFHYLKVLVHELAHMWFGDLVTLKWWNDLWLKESFADFSAALCLNHIASSFKGTIKNPD